MFGFNGQEGQIFLTETFCQIHPLYLRLIFNHLQSIPPLIVTNYATVLLR